MNKTLCIQAYSVHDLMQEEATAREAFQALASYGYTGVQTAGECKWGFENYADAVKSAGLRIIGTHLPMDFHKNEEKAVHVHKLFETKYAGIGGMPGLWDEDFGKEKLNAFIETANNIAEIFSKHGLLFTYHNHDREFYKFGNELVMDILLRELDKRIVFVPDTYWLQVGGVNILEWLKKFEGRMPILHLKDYEVPFPIGGARITELGNGNINFKDVIKAAECYGVEELCYEQDSGHKIDPLSSAKQSAEYFYSIL